MSKFLFTYCLTIHSTTSQCPHWLLLKYCPWSKLDVLFPNIESYVEQHQQTQKNAHDRHSKHYRAYVLTSRKVTKNSNCCYGAIFSGKSTFIHKSGSI